MLKRALVLLTLLAAFTVTAQEPIRITVDATDAPRKVFHSHSTIPAKPGPLRLGYAQWIPGEHGPTGPITDLVNLRITANGQPVTWARDPRNMFAFDVVVPSGASSVDVDLTYLSPISGGNFTSGPNASANVAIVGWNTLMLFPIGRSADTILVEGSVKVPEGWSQAGALKPNERASVMTYIDSPVIIGRYLKTVDLPSGNGPKHRINLSGESAAAIETPATFADDYGRLVAEAGALFGAYHFRHYDWLVTLSDHVAHFGLEHHESSDNRMEERTLETPEMRRALGGLLSHEYMHSWNAKYRRPAIMLSPDYQQPMEGNLLWVYEGLTQYLGTLLATRSGLWTPEYYRENVAAIAGRFDVQPGRTWRPLSDTAVAAQILFGSPTAWESSRRGTDFYDESVLLWLEADSILRQKSSGRASMDDFLRRFHGGNTGVPELKPYTYDELIAALNAVAPYDWRKHFDERLSSLSQRAPVAGLTNDGWRVVFNETPNEAIQGTEERRKIIDLTYSLGLSLKNGDNADRGTVRDVWIGGPAANAGIGPGMKIIAVNGRRWTREVLDKAIRAKGPLELLIQNNDDFKTYSVDYHGGMRYPHLEKIEGKTDTLADVLKARAAR